MLSGPRHARCATLSRRPGFRRLDRQSVLVTGWGHGGKNGDVDMKAFLAALIAMAAITIGADLLLHQAEFSSAEWFSLDSVRLGE